MMTHISAVIQLSAKDVIGKTAMTSWVAGYILMHTGDFRKFPSHLKKNHLVDIMKKTHQ